jgi:hypothetical protein
MADGPVHRRRPHGRRRAPPLDPRSSHGLTPGRPPLSGAYRDAKVPGRLPDLPSRHSAPTITTQCPPGRGMRRSAAGTPAYTVAGRE